MDVHWYQAFNPLKKTYTGVEATNKKIERATVELQPRPTP